MITTIAIYKVTNSSRVEVEAMLGITLKETRIYQEVKEQGRTEGIEEMVARTVPMLLEAGFSIEQIAEHLRVELEIVRRFAAG